MQFKMSASVPFGAALLLAACGGGGGSSTSALLSPPTAAAIANVSQGTAPLTVNFDASGSKDPQGYSLTFNWNFGDGSSGATGATVAHTYQDHGTYTATVTVSDGHNNASKTLTVTVNPAPPTVQTLSLPVNVLGVAPTTVQALLSASDRENLSLTYTLKSPPSVGSATVDGTSGSISYTLPGFVSATSDSFVVTVANLGASTDSTVSVALNGDPLLVNQWHIQNVGQIAFASTLPIAGNDMDVTGAWTAGYSGKGIKVGVVDSGLEAAHEDLQANVDLSHSYNFLTGTNDPTPTAVGFDHGTQVAGIIAAVAFNGKGGRGIAFNATLRGYNLLAAGADNDSNFAASLGSSAISADNDLFNLSFGVENPALPQFSQAIQAISVNTTTLRGGLGAAVVNAAGNDFRDFESTPGLYCGTAQQYGVSCGDPASDQRRGGDYPIVVGALDTTGLHASYGSTGSSLWISAPGGEYGLNSSTLGNSLTSTLTDPTHDLMPAIITTALTGCANAYNPFLLSAPVPLNPLDDLGANPLASDCQYTAVMNGTSAATPNVSGTVAMMLEANPKLSVRDIKYILAKTAKQPDPAFSGISSANIIAGSTVVLEQGWVTNGAGYSFSNRYGFGAVDAAAAVAMAKSYTSFLPALQNSNSYPFLAAAPALIPAASTTGGFINFAVSENFSTVEFAVVFVSIASTPGLPCNQIELTSPSGTKSILLHAANGFTNASVPLSRFESNAFYGEPVNGNWVLRFLDFCAASATSTTLSTTQSQMLLLAGH
jgi:PKD repeat protein